MVEDARRDAAGDLGEIEARHELMRERGREQHDRQRLIQTSLAATLQMDSIVVAALIAVILIQVDLPAFERAGAFSPYSRWCWC